MSYEEDSRHRLSPSCLLLPFPPTSMKSQRICRCKSLIRPRTPSFVVLFNSFIYRKCPSSFLLSTYKWTDWSTVTLPMIVSVSSLLIKEWRHLHRTFPAEFADMLAKIWRRSIWRSLECWRTIWRICRSATKSTNSLKRLLFWKFFFFWIWWFHFLLFFGEQERSRKSKFFLKNTNHKEKKKILFVERKNSEDVLVRRQKSTRGFKSPQNNITFDCLQHLCAGNVALTCFWPFFVYYKKFSKTKIPIVNSLRKTSLVTVY